MKSSPDKFPAESMVRPNRHIITRLRAIQDMLLAAHAAGGKMSSASKGNERETFVSSFLRQVFPAHFRFGTGDITDSDERISGQVDVVVEYPNLYSFPVFEASPRLYLAEGVAATVEIKSDLSTQWSQVEKTASKLKKIKTPIQRFLAARRGRTLRIGR